jgi:hypothetical protein
MIGGMIKTGAVIASLLLWSAMPAAEAVAAQPVVVELFTSEGCSSCPPADALLAELADRPDLLTLSFHVDYWDRLGWRDPFSSPAATARQEHYAGLLGHETVYTPQIVVDGRWQAVGSDRSDVDRALAAAGSKAATLSVRLTVDHDRAEISIGPNAGAAGASVVLIGFDRRRADTVERGENAGRTLTHVDVVLGIEEVGRFSGGANRIAAPVPWPSDRLAAIVQAPNGHVLGAAAVDRDPH